MERAIEILRVVSASLLLIWLLLQFMKINIKGKYAIRIIVSILWIFAILASLIFKQIIGESIAVNIPLLIIALIVFVISLCEKDE